MPSPTPPKKKRLKSKESLYFPSVQSKKWKNIDQDIRWNLEDIMNHIFPKEYQEKSYQYAVKLMYFLIENPRGIGKKDLSEFIKKEEIPKSTLYNVVIPKLVKFGILERKRETNISNPNKGWFMILKPSISFSSHLQKLSREWRSIYKTATSENK